MVSKSAAAKPDAVIDWYKVADLASARALLTTVVDSTDVLGDGAEFITDKNVLVGVPFLILEWRFIVDEKSGREFVNVHIMGLDGRRARFNDGGTGVCEQLRKVSDEMGIVGINVKDGLRRSDYVKDGVGDATTYYLSN